jgi:hypothetical protein
MRSHIKKSALTSSILFFLSTNVSANHGVEAMGAFFEFVIVMGLIAVSTIVLIIAYFYKKRKPSAVAILMSMLSVIIIGYLLNHLPDSPYYYLQEWLAMWSVAIIAILIMGVIIAKHFIALYRKK